MSERLTDEQLRPHGPHGHAPMRKPVVKKYALENGVPQNGAHAFSEGWDISACPFNYDPQKQRWIDEWNDANALAYAALKDAPQ